MKTTIKNLFALVAVLFTLASCSKNDTDYFDANKQFELDAQAIKTYVNAKFPLSVLDTNSGIWFQTIAEGDGLYQYTTKDTVVNGQSQKIVVAPKITVRYTGKLLDGTVFDENNSATGISGILSQFIPAWHIAFLPKKIGDKVANGLTVKGLTKGSKIHIVTPSYWAYGNFAQAKIPANSPLDFTIEVVDIK
ncbi:FKBP-type peptidyl-prolyl cis-trans isomerase [Sphingobacterium sp. SRCM116780]|uniref:FKBP-type peptidyl-prolyl cis-trans isomerase n=1 Tax=Sphingobacterium sp. SRCM116780 TaxID=2907623 RepID=UPI001F24C38F|nr:FKBP-type peptidyl-prolyl cis-trans isomerase [Sphingobacterium sp. SRCM116780]UIR56235.1 FKBP-type peptidyl-prolyl cis-trans isomerase [Sphingobacterium sp. SRCM116780]